LEHYANEPRFINAIRSLDGLQYVTNLANLTLIAELFTDLKPITKLSKLKTIYFDYVTTITDLTSIADAVWPELTHLTLESLEPDYEN